jgi:hypothetical protein
VRACDQEAYKLSRSTPSEVSCPGTSSRELEDKGKKQLVAVEIHHVQKGGTLL